MTSYHNRLSQMLIKINCIHCACYRSRTVMFWSVQIEPDGYDYGMQWILAHRWLKSLLILSRFIVFVQIEICFSLVQGKAQLFCCISILFTISEVVGYSVKDRTRSRSTRFVFFSQNQLIQLLFSSLLLVLFYAWFLLFGALQNRYPFYR